jgi:hypothetical protein
MEHLPEKFYGLRVFGCLTPQEFCVPHLSKGIVAKGKLPDRNVSRCELPDAKQSSDGELRNSSQAKNELTETEQDANAELGKGNKTDAKLPDRDHAPGDTKPVILVAPEGNMY